MTNETIYCSKQSPSAIESYKKYGVTKNEVAHMLINFFHYPETYLDTLEEYFILHWKSKYFIEKLSNGSISHNFLNRSTEYLVVYQNCTPAGVKKAHSVKLSFRKPKNEFDLMNYVIIRIANNGEGKMI